MQRCEFPRKRQSPQRPKDHKGRTKKVQRTTKDKALLPFCSGMLSLCALRDLCVFVVSAFFWAKPASFEGSFMRNALALALCLPLAFSPAQAQEARRPNVLFIL